MPLYDSVGVAFCPISYWPIDLQISPHACCLPLSHWAKACSKIPGDIQLAGPGSLL